MVFKKKAKIEPTRVEFENDEDQEEQEEQDEEFENEPDMSQLPPMPKPQRKQTEQYPAQVKQQQQSQQKKALTPSEYADLIQGNLERAYKVLLEFKQTYNI